MDKTEQFNRLKPILASIAAGVAREFGDSCEVAVHNLSKGYDSTIEIIENGHVTDRKVGDGASEIVLQTLVDRDVEDRYSYITHSKDGRLLKSSTINIRGIEGEVIAVVSINYDISNLTLTNTIISEFVGTKTEKDSTPITNNVSELLENLIEESRLLIGKPVSAMTKEDKVTAIQYLDKKGALLIKKSSERISEYYGISKYTLYNYLGNTEVE